MTATPTGYVTSIRALNGDVWFLGFDPDCDMADWAEDELDPGVQLWPRYDPDSDEERATQRQIEDTLAKLLAHGHDCEAVTMMA
jgi:hypothetical protein